MPEVYQQIADRDTFEIFMRNLKELLSPLETPSQNTTGSRKKKKTPEEL